jgi:hypothetical protein
MLENALLTMVSRGNEILLRVPSDACLADRREDRPPQEDLRHNRQEPHKRAEHKIAPIDQPLRQANPENGPPGA